MSVILFLMVLFLSTTWKFLFAGHPAYRLVYIYVHVFTYIQASLYLRTCLYLKPWIRAVCSLRHCNGPIKINLTVHTSVLQDKILKYFTYFEYVRDSPNKYGTGKIRYKICTAPNIDMKKLTYWILRIVLKFFPYKSELRASTICVIHMYAHDMLMLRLVVLVIASWFWVFLSGVSRWSVDEFACCWYSNFVFFRFF